MREMAELVLEQQPWRNEDTVSEPKRWWSSLETSLPGLSVGLTEETHRFTHMPGCQTLTRLHFGVPSPYLGRDA